MKEEYHKWYSPYMSRDIEMLVFGHGGVPVILFPTSAGVYYENKDFLMMEAVSWFLENGKVRIYCPASINLDSWYNKNIHPADRVRTHEAWERTIINEVVKKAQTDNNAAKVVFAGCSFGGYLAANTGFRHPHLTSHVFSMSGSFGITGFLDGFYDQSVYFNNPVDYIGGMEEGEKLWQIRQLGIILGVADHDNCKDQNFGFAKILQGKGINHWLDFRPGTYHDWPVWREMFPHYLSLL